MDIVEITGRENRIIKEIRSLQLKKNRIAGRRFVIEGFKLLREAVLSGCYPCYVVVSDKVSDKTIDNIPKESKEAEGPLSFLKPSTAVYSVPESIFSGISETESPQGVLAVFGLPDSVHYMNSEVPAASGLFDKADTFVLILEDIRDPGNLGTIIRSADAFGCECVVLSPGCADIFNAKTIRSTMGSIFHLPIIIADDVISVIKDMKCNGFKIYATAPDAAKSCSDTDLTRSIGVIVGNEAHGISTELLDAADEHIAIRMPGRAESLNAASAAAVLLYEVSRQRK